MAGGEELAAGTTEQPGTHLLKHLEVSGTNFGCSDSAYLGRRDNSMRSLDCTRVKMRTT